MKNITVEEMTETLKNVSFVDLMTARSNNDEAAEKLREMVMKTVLPMLRDTGTGARDACKLIIYVGVVALQTVIDVQEEAARNN